MGAQVSYSSMERVWLVWPGGGARTLCFDSEAEAYAARDALDAGQPLPARTAPPAVADKTAFMPSRSTKGDLDHAQVHGLAFAPLAEIGKRKLTPEIERQRFAVPALPPVAKEALVVAPAPAAKRSTAGKKLVEIDIQRAAKMYGDGASTREVAKAEGVCIVTLKKRFAEAKIDLRKSGCPKYGQKAIDIARALALFEENRSVRKTASLLRVNAMTLRSALRAAGAKIGTRKRRSAETEQPAPARLDTVALVDASESVTRDGLPHLSGVTAGETALHLLRLASAVDQIVSGFQAFAAELSRAAFLLREQSSSDARRAKP